MPRHRVRFRMSQVLVAAAVGLSTAACSGAIPRDSANALLTTPSPTALAGGMGLAGGTSSTLDQDVDEFTLVNGEFTFTSDEGELTGTFNNDTVTVPTEGRPKVTMDLDVTGGSGWFTGATGTLVGDGNGAFLGDGDFVLILSGLVETAGEPLKFHATVVGTADPPLGCRSGHILSQLQGEATIATVGRARMVLESEILETFCF